MARARAALHRLRPDRTIAHFVVPSAYPLAIGSTGELDVVLHGSDARLVCALPNGVRAEIARALLARGATLRFSSEHLRRAFIDRMPPRMQPALGARSRVAMPSLSLPDGLAARRRPLGPREDWVTCGRLIPSKRIDRVIREAAKRGAQLTVVGDGPERERLRALAYQILPNARFVGQVPHDRALAHIAAADRLVHFSALEGAPSVIREARAMGVPVLATPAGDVAAWAARDPGIQLFEMSEDEG